MTFEFGHLLDPIGHQQVHGEARSAPADAAAPAPAGSVVPSRPVNDWDGQTGELDADAWLFDLLTESERETDRVLDDDGAPVELPRPAPGTQIPGLPAPTGPQVAPEAPPAPAPIPAEPVVPLPPAASPAPSAPVVPTPVVEIPVARTPVAPAPVAPTPVAPSPVTSEAPVPAPAEAPVAASTASAPVAPTPGPVVVPSPAAQAVVAAPAIGQPSADGEPASPERSRFAGSSVDDDRLPVRKGRR